MTDFLALALAIALLIQLQRARAVLSFVFPRVSARRIELTQPPEAIADLFHAADATLRELGFDGPHWYRRENTDMPGEPDDVAVAYVQAESFDTVWMHAPAAATMPNRLPVYFARRLRDGRWACSQVFDAYAELIGSERFPAQSIGGETLQQQWALHRHWCDSLGEVDPAGIDAAQRDWQAADWHNERRETLIARGLVYADRRGLIRPGWRLAWRMLALIRRTPKPAPNREPVPPQRLAWLAQVAQRVAARTVPRRVQVGLFALSVALFLLAGGIIWGLRFAQILFVVVTIHELGHYLAMRLFGYRNVQMVALPLVGGVTIGHEVVPDAARRAWMSLMGPLPGIVIGWILVWLCYVGSPADEWAQWGREAAWVFLAVNYLNVLPVPPLDGAHVVQALLPVRAARLGACFVAVAALLGAAMAVWAGFYLLALLAFLQLGLVRTRWQLAQVVERLWRQPTTQGASSEQRLREVFERFDAVAGPTALAPARLAAAAEAMRSVELKPMRWPQRSLISLIYLVLLAGPVAVGAALWLSRPGQLIGALLASDAVPAMAAAREDRMGADTPRTDSADRQRTRAGSD